jgi:hypothetical protein
VTRLRRRRRIPGWALAVAAGILFASAVGLPGPRSSSAAELSPAPAPRVLLVVEQADDPFANRLRAELSSLGLTVLTLEPWRSGIRVETLEGAARAEGAAAAIRTVPSRKGVEIWMADQVTGRPLLRQMVVDESPGGPNQSLVALQTAELMRTSLLARPLPPPAAAPPVADIVAASPPPPPSPGAAASEIGIGMGVGTLYSPGGVGTALQVWLTLHRLTGRHGRWRELALDLSAPARAATLAGPEGTSSVQTYLAAVALLARVEMPAGLVFDGGVGAGAVVVVVEGRATTPLVERSDALVTAVGYARADLSLEATRWLRLGVRAVGGVAAERTSIRFAGNDAGAWGPFFGAGLGLVELYFR